MQWTLRSMFLVRAGVGYCIAGVTTFGIVATTTPIVILGAARFVHSRMTSGGRGWPKRLALAEVTLAILYGMGGIARDR